MRIIVAASVLTALVQAVALRRRNTPNAPPALDTAGDLSWSTQQTIEAKTERYRKTVPDEYKFYTWNETYTTQRPCLHDRYIPGFDELKDREKERCDYASFLRYHHMNVTAWHVFARHQTLDSQTSASDILPLTESNGDTFGHDDSSTTSSSLRSSAGISSPYVSAGQEVTLETSQTSSSSRTKSHDSTSWRNCPAHARCSRVRVTWHVTLTGPASIEPVVFCGRPVRPCAEHTGADETCPEYTIWAQPMCSDWAARVGKERTVTIPLRDYTGNVISEIVHDDDHLGPVPVGCDAKNNIKLSNGETFDPDTGMYYRDGDYSVPVYKRPTDPLPVLPETNPCKKSLSDKGRLERAAEELQELLGEAGPDEDAWDPSQMELIRQKMVELEALDESLGEQDDHDQLRGGVGVPEDEEEDDDDAGEHPEDETDVNDDIEPPETEDDVNATNQMVPEEEEEDASEHHEIEADDQDVEPQDSTDANSAGQDDASEHQTTETDDVNATDQLVPENGGEHQATDEEDDSEPPKTEDVDSAKQLVPGDDDDDDAGEHQDEIKAHIHSEPHDFNDAHAVPKQPSDALDRLWSEKVHAKPQPEGEEAKPRLEGEEAVQTQTDVGKEAKPRSRRESGGVQAEKEASVSPNQSLDNTNQSLDNTNQSLGNTNQSLDKNNKNASPQESHVPLEPQGSKNVPAEKEASVSLDQSQNNKVSPKQVSDVPLEPQGKKASLKVPLHQSQKNSTKTDVDAQSQQINSHDQLAEQQGNEKQPRPASSPAASKTA